MEEQLPDFTNQTVVFYISTNQNLPEWVNEGIPIVSPIFQKIGNRYFVVGKNPDFNNNHWTSNRETGISWDSVFSFVVVPSEEYDEINNLES